MTFGPESLDALRAAYPDAPARLRHELTDHPLFALGRLAELAAALPEDRLEYNRGDLGVSHDPDDPAGNGLGPAETVRTIEENASWMVMKNVEADPRYRALMDDCLDALSPVTTPATGADHRRQAYVFLSSPGSMTPFHMDPEHNVLCQVRGTKTMRVYPRDAGIAEQQQHEAFHAGAHRNLVHDERFDARAETFELAAGDALHVPVKAPHWVRNGEGVSVSFSITWRSAASVAESELHLANRWLRARGLEPRPPGGPMDAPKRAAYRAGRRAGLID